MNEAMSNLRSITLAAPFVADVPNCGPPLIPNIASITLKYGWSVALECSTCCHQWYVCKLCSSARFGYSTDRSLYDHNYQVHHDHPTKKNRIDNQSDCKDVSINMSDCSRPWDFSDDVVAPSASHATPSVNENVLLQTLALPGPPRIELRGEYNNNYFRTQNSSGLGNT